MKIEQLENRQLLAGQLDSSFGTAGVATSDIGGILSQTNASAVQLDGKIVSVGFRLRQAATLVDEAFIVRNNATGATDTLFGTSGIVIPSLAGTTASEAMAVAIQSDQKIVVASMVRRAATGQDIAISRFLSTGAIDPSFGTAGTIFIDFAGADDAPGAMVIQSDNKILVAGRATLPDGTYGIVSQFAVVRLTTAGALDTTFNTTGKETISLNVDGQEISQVNAMAIASGGKIVLAGATQSGDISLGTQATRFSLVRLASTGAIDTTFNLTGRVLTNFPSQANFDQINALSIQSDGKILAAGSTQLDSGATAMAIARYQATGSPDASFGAAGLQTISIAANGSETATGIFAQANGKIIVSGTSGTSSSPYHNYAIAQLSSTGALVASFGTAGVTTTDFGNSNDDQSRAAVMLSDGKIILAGSSYSTSLGRYIHGLAKYVGDSLSITGTLYSDANGNRVKDLAEAGMSGWQLFLDLNKDGLLTGGEPTATTDASGNYSFNNLAAASYRVRVTTQAGYRVSYPTAGYQDVVTGVFINSSARNFGVTQRILISGQVFNDLNGNGIKDTLAESFLSGRRVYIDANNDGIWQAGETSVLTDASGNWSFYTLTAGTYIIRIVNPAGWTTTAPATGKYTITLSNGGTSSSNWFGQKLI